MIAVLFIVTVFEGNCFMSACIYVKPYICLVLVSLVVSHISLIRHCVLHMYFVRLRRPYDR